MAWIIESFFREDSIAAACEKATFSERMAAAGLASLLDDHGAPRKRCAVLAAAGECKEALL